MYAVTVPTEHKDSTYIVTSSEPGTEMIDDRKQPTRTRQQHPRWCDYQDGHGTMSWSHAVVNGVQVDEVELDELVTQLDNHLAAGDQADPLEAGISAKASRLTTLLAGAAAPDPKVAVALIRYLWQRFWALPVGTSQPVLQSAARLASLLPTVQQASLPLGLQALIDIDPQHTGDSAVWQDAALAPDCNVDRSIALLSLTAHTLAPASLDRGPCLANLSTRHYVRFLEHDTPHDLDLAISTLSEAAPLFDDTFGSLPDLYANLSLMLRIRYRSEGAPSDLDEAIDYGRHAAVMPSQGQAVILSGLSIALGHRFRLHHEQADLDEAIAFARQARNLMDPHHAEVRVVMTNLARLLSYQHERTETETALEAATDVARSAAAPVLATFGRDPDADRQCADTLAILGEMLARRYKQKQDPRDLEDALQAVAALLEITAPTSPSRAETLRQQGTLLFLRFLRSEHLSDLDAAITCLNEAGMYWLRRYRQTGAEEEAFEAIRTFRMAAEAAGTDGPDAEAVAANNLGVILIELPSELLNEQLALEAVQALRRSVDLSEQDEPYLPGRWSGLCAALTRLHRLTADPGVLREAVAAGRCGVDLTPAGHPSAGMHLSNLGGALSHRPEMALAEVAETADVFRRAVAALPSGHRARPGALFNLATALNNAGQATGEPTLLSEAVVALREANAATPPGPRRQSILRALTSSLQAQFQRTRDPSDLADAVAYARELLALKRPATADTQRLAVEIAELLRQANPRLNDHAIARDEAGILQGHLTIPAPAAPDTPARLCLIGLKLLDLADSLDDHDLRTDAVTALRNAVNATLPDDPQLTRYQACLVTGLRETYLQTRDVTLLREEIGLADAVLQATPADHPDLLLRLEASIWALQRLQADTGDHSRLEDTYAQATRAAQTQGADWENQLTLAEVLMQRGRVDGDQALMERAVLIGRGAIADIPSEHHDHHRSVGNFAAILMEQYHRTGALELLNEAIALARPVVDVTNGSRSALTGVTNTLALCLSLRYERTGDINALRESVQVQRRAAAAVPVGYPYRGLYLDNLRQVLLTLGHVENDIDLLREAADWARAAIDSANDNPSVRALTSAGLADVLLAQYESTGDTAVLAEAEDAAEAALREGDGHPQRDFLLQTLARTLMAHPSALDDRAVVQRARELQAEAATHPAGANHNRLIAASRWADLAMRFDDPDDALRACEHAVELLLVHASPALQRADRERGLRDTSWLPRTVAAAAIAARRPERAVELLEQVRGILMAEALHAHQDLSDIHAHDPGLAAEFAHVSSELAVIHREPATKSTSLAAGSLAVEQRAELSRRWQDAVQRIRDLPDHSDFLRPLAIASLQEGIDGGRIVIVSTSEWRSDALILDGRTVSAVELTGLHATEAVKRTNAYLIALQDFQAAQAQLAAARDTAEGSRDLAALHQYQVAKAAYPRRLSTMEETLDTTLEWLWNVIAEPVLRHLGLTAAPADGEPWPRIWWCPTGPLALLPLHAAGRHRTQPAHSVIERVVSSYTPTVRAFQAARTAGSSPQPNDLRMLVVALPATEGQQPLPNALRERDLLLGFFPGRLHTLLEGNAATRAAVLRELPRHTWIHLSCHGDQDLRNPSNGGLLLADGILSIVDINRQSQRAELAFLSACKTATTGVELTDEMMTLATAMHYGGSRHVIATLWSVYDPIAADIAEHLYRDLIRDGQPAAEGAANALHHATRWLRREHPDNPSTWIPFVHIGP
ncbi:MAG: CHAT domain-containing protein [Pseudonocardiaceae bacterium]